MSNYRRGAPISKSKKRSGLIPRAAAHPPICSYTLIPREDRRSFAWFRVQPRWNPAGAARARRWEGLAEQARRN